MTPEKKAERRARNQKAKFMKAVVNRQNMALLGKLVFEREVETDELNEDGTQKTVKVLDFPPAIRTSTSGQILPLKQRDFSIHPKIAGYGSTSLLPLLSKGHKQSGFAMRTRPGNKVLHGEAIVEDASRSFTKAVDAALAPVEQPIPVVPENLAGEAAQL